MTTPSGLTVRVFKPARRRIASGTILPLRPRNVEREAAPDMRAYEPTPLEHAHEQAPIEIVSVNTKTRSRRIWAVWQFLRFAAIYLGRKVRRRENEEQTARMVRELFEELGGVWIKVGQLLSLRTDLMPEAICRQLATLQYRRHGFAPEIARRVIEEELGRPITSVFSYFEDAPIAAASIAQVHRGTLVSNNRAVIVKVMRPGIADEFKRDLRLLENIANVLNHGAIFRRFRLREGLDELRAMLSEETDYRYEIVNLKRMRKNLKDHGVFVPRVITRLSTLRVLVMEEVPGVLMSQYIRMRQEDPERLHRWALLNGIDTEEIATQLAGTTLRQILEDNEFHGDLHPGNIMLLSDNRIALIDVGSVGRLPHHTWSLYRQSLAALATSDHERAADIMLMMSPSVDWGTVKDLRRDMSEALRDWELTGQFPHADYNQRSIAAMSERVAEVMARHNVPLSWGILRVGRTLSTLDASLQTLAPDADFLKLCRHYYEDVRRRARTPKGRAESLEHFIGDLRTLGADVKLLVGSGLRYQALRLHGMLDPLTHVRMAVLGFLHRVLRMILVLFLVVCGLDTAYDYGLAVHLGPLYPLAVRANDALPNLRSEDWALTLGIIFVLVRLLRVTRNAITRLG